MTAPQSIHDVLRGPHIKDLVHDGVAAVVVADPLRFLPVVRIGDRDRVLDRGARRG